MFVSYGTLILYTKYFQLIKPDNEFFIKIIQQNTYPNNVRELLRIDSQPIILHFAGFLFFLFIFLYIFMSIVCKHTLNV